MTKPSFFHIIFIPLSLYLTTIVLKTRPAKTRRKIAHRFEGEKDDMLLSSLDKITIFLRVKFWEVCQPTTGPDISPFRNFWGKKVNELKKKIPAEAAAFEMWFWEQKGWNLTGRVRRQTETGTDPSAAVGRTLAPSSGRARSANLRFRKIIEFFECKFF